MFWFFYVIASIFLSLNLARRSKKYFFEYFILSLVIFITPAQIEVSAANYAPSLFTFILNIFFGEEFSTRVLRPLLISLPLTLSLLILCSIFKRRFF